MTVVVGVDDEVGSNLVNISAHGFAKRSSRLRVQAFHLCFESIGLHLAQAKCIGNLVPMFLGELLEMISYHAVHKLFQSTVGFATNLYEQTLLQTAGANSGRIKILEFLQHRLYLLRLHIHIVVDGKFVADGIDVFSQETAIVERTYEIFHYPLLGVRKLYLAHLLFQSVVERHRVAIHHLLVVGIIIIVCRPHGQHIVVVGDGVESRV